MSKNLENMSEEEWESVCNKCGKCCLVKLEDEDSGDVYYTDIVCKFFNPDSCECTEYKNRCTLVPECLKLTKENIDKISWMPKTCAYRCLLEGKPKPTCETISSFCISEQLINEEDFEDHILDRDDL